MQSTSGSQAAGLRSRSRSAQSFAFVPARSEAYPYTISRQYLKGGTAKLRAQEPDAPIDGSRLKATKQGPLGSRCLSTTSGNSKSYIGGQPPTLKIKAATVSSGQTSQASKRHVIATGPSRNVTTVTPIPHPQRQASQQQNTGHKKGMPITTKVLTSTPPPKKKIHKDSKPAILAELDTASLFSPVRSPPNKECIEFCNNGKCDLPSPLLRSSLRAESLHTLPVELPLEVLSSQELRRTRSALSLPSRHLKSRVKGACKTVTWDPSLESVDPEMPSISESAPEEGEKAENSGAPQQVSTRKLEVKDCVETPKEWGNTDRSKLANLIEALKQLKLRSENTKKECATAKSNSGHDEEIFITVVKSMDPRVPQFESSRIAEAETKIVREEERDMYRPAMLSVDSFNDSDSNKENIPNFHLQPLAFPQDKGVRRIKKRISVVDDYNSPGREVDSFADWYAQMQLREFAKRYPLTGRRASTVRQAAKISPSIAKVSDNIRSLLEGSDLAAKEFKSSITRGGNPSNMGEADQTGRREVGKATAGPERRNGYAGRKLALPKRREKHFSTDLAARKNAATIQQQLEILLLKEKERKALGGMPGTASMSFGHGDGGAAIAGAKPHYGGVGYEERPPATASLWIPSERLKLKSALSA